MLLELVAMTGVPSDAPDYAYRIHDEPKPDDAPVDYAYLYSLMRERRNSAGERIEKVDTKTATIIAGILAVMGVSLDHVQTWYQAAAVLLYAIPLVYLYLAYRTSGWADSPSAAILVAKYPWYPMTTLAVAIEAMAEESTINGDAMARKARRLNIGFALALAVTFVIVLTRVIAQFDGAAHGAPASVGTIHTVPSPTHP